MLPKLFKTSRGMTLIEMMVAAGVLMVIGTGLAMGLASLQKVFSATINYTGDHASEMRISDYISRDLRSATKVAITGTGGGTILTVSLPNFYDSTGNPRTPVISADGSVSYQDASTPPVTSGTVTYYMSNGSMYRATSGTQKVLATSVQTFQLTIIDSALSASGTTIFNLPTSISGKVAEVKTQVAFSPVFSAYGSTANGVQATTFYNTTLMRNASVSGTANITLY